MVRLAAVIVAGLMSFSSFAQSEGAWFETPAGLPYCRYDGNGRDVRSLLGNYRIDVITHADGIYQILSGERVWAGFNADPLAVDYGRNRATLNMGRRPVELVGGKASFSVDNYDYFTGIGFSRYDYKLDGGLRCSRMISVMPSDEVNGGNPCFVITVTFTNSGHGAKSFSYEEVFSPFFLPVADGNLASSKRAFAYPMTTEISFRCLKASFKPEKQRFMNMPSSQERYRYEVAPQSVFLYAKDAFLSIADGEFKAQFHDMKLKRGEKRVLNIVIGFTKNNDAKELAEKVLVMAAEGQYGAFEAMWKKRIPDFSGEKNRAVRREMYMNAHELEASAVYNSCFDETFIPGESGDVYRTGANLSNRDHLQRAMPVCYSNPELAKSVLEYVMKHAEPDGRIYAGNTGYGYVSYEYMSEYHDLQIHFLHLLAEYLRVTGDYGFLDESVKLYSGESMNVLSFVENSFICLRDDVLLDDDPLAYFKNQSLVSSYFPVLISEMKKSGKAPEEFVKSLEEYTDFAWDSFRKSDINLEEDNTHMKSLALYNYFRAKE